MEITPLKEENFIKDDRVDAWRHFLERGLIEDSGLVFKINPSQEAVIMDNEGRTCRQCGCSDNDACIHQEHGNCWWVERDLCSHCKYWPGESKRFAELK